MMLIWGNRSWVLNRNRAGGEPRSFAGHFKKALRKEHRCEVEIRSPVGSETLVAAKRLLRGFQMAGFTGRVLEVVATPCEGILVESDLELSGAALSIQSAFKMVGLEAEVLVQASSRPNLVILHLGRKAGLAT